MKYIQPPLSCTLCIYVAVGTTETGEGLHILNVNHVKATLND